MRTKFYHSELRDRLAELHKTVPMFPRSMQETKVKFSILTNKN